VSVTVINICRYLFICFLFIYFVIDDDEDSFQEEIIEFLVSEEIMIIDNNE
jgi:hypothetical protein